MAGSRLPCAAGSLTRWLAAIALTLGAIAACQELDVTAVGVMHVDVSPDAADVAIGRTQRFTATLTDAEGHELRDRTVTWSIAEPAVATVDQDGQVLGVAPGQTTITATAEGRTGQATVNVTGAPVAAVEVAPPSATLRPGEGLQLQATTRDAGGAVLGGRAVAWASSNAAVAAVDGAGRVTAGTVGEATITATSEGVSGQSVITVSVDVVASVEVVPGSASVEEGTTFQLQAVLRSESGAPISGRPVSWTTSDGATAGVSTTGLVSGIRAGTATITATAEGKSGQSVITVTPPLAATIEVTPPSTSLVVGGTVQLQATAKTASGAVIQGRPFAWSSSAPGVAEVNTDGLVTGRAVGDATITATMDGASGTARVFVALAPVATVEVAPPGGNLTVGDTLTLTAIARSVDGTVLSNRAVTWSTSDAAVASITGNGSTALIRATGAGQATITATSEGQSGTAVFTVVQKPVASVVVVPGSANIVIDETRQLQAVLTASDGTPLSGRPVTWSTSDAAIAAVDGNGLVRGVAAGVATITATAEGQAGQASITVGLKPVASVVIAPPTADLVVGGTVQFTVTLTASDGTPLTGRVVTWASTNTAVAQVDGAGKATAVSIGATNIIATSEGKADTAVVTVSPKPVATVTVTPALDTLFVGETVQLSAELRAADNTVLTGRPVTWSTSNAGSAQVSGTGLVTAVAAGQATITATAEGKTGQATIVVRALPVGSVEIQPATATVLHPNSQVYQVTVRATNNTVLTNRQVSWRSLDPAIATVTPGSGVALTGTATSVGITCTGQSCTARIEASAEGVADTATLVVLKPVATIALSPPAATVAPGSSTTLQAEVKAADGTLLSSRRLEWSSSSNNVTVQPSGGAQQSATVQAVAANCSGSACTATVTATAEGKSGTATITIPKPVGSVTVAPASLDLEEGEDADLTATVRAADGTVLSDRAVTWTTTNASVVEVNGTGQYRLAAKAHARTCPVGSGSCTATIRASVEGKTFDVSVRVEKVVANVALDPSTAILTEGATQVLKAVLTASDGTVLTRRVRWSTSAAAVASVVGNGGQDMEATVTANAVGTAIITATSEGVDATAAITVIERVASVEIQPGSVTLAEGAMQTVAAVVKGTSGGVLADRQVTWSSTAPSIATATGTGGFNQSATLTAGSCPQGSASCTATIRATAGGVTGSATVRVEKQVATVTVTPAPPPDLLPGGTLQLAATPRASDGTNLSAVYPVTWASADPAVASVDPTTGLVTAVGAPCAVGSPSCATTVTATAGGQSGAVTVRVLKPVATVEVIPVPPPALLPGETMQLGARLTASDGTDLTGTRTVTWTSSDEATARVDANGVVTAIAAVCAQGQQSCQAVVTASAGGVSNGVTVTVLKPVYRVVVDPTQAFLSITVNPTQVFGATPFAEDDTPLTNRTITWSLEIPTGSLGNGTFSPASGNSTTFTGTQVGAVVLVATAEGKRGSATIAITP